MRGTHGREERTFRRLPNYKARMQCLNAWTMKLREYARVMLGLDTTPQRSRSRVIQTIVRRVEREITAINRLL